MRISCILSVIMFISGSMDYSYSISNSLACVSTHLLSSNQTDHSNEDQLLQKLHSYDIRELSKTKRDLIILANTTDEARGYIVRELTEIVGGPEKLSNTVIHPDNFDTWKAATELLGELKATEAVGVLIECLACNNGRTNMSTSLYPAARAIISIGKPAFPAIEQALSHVQQPIRYVAVLALGEIGSKRAKAALKRALRKEKDKQLTFVIRQILQNW